MSLVLDTATVSDSDKVAYWSEALARAFVAVTVTLRDAGSFSGTITTGWCGYLQVSTGPTSVMTVLGRVPLRELPSMPGSQYSSGAFSLIRSYTENPYSPGRHPRRAVPWRAGN
ncbi:hypothetical protein OHA25_22980 [Nonomuraea sp. NBC_00507]|uniref:hypothetical protein n=1 Tax=Nonomuraea sp. NBC_00507 TaxID=2976002 RepID=UPI002E17FE4F